MDLEVLYAKRDNISSSSNVGIANSEDEVMSGVATGKTRIGMTLKAAAEVNEPTRWFEAAKRKQEGKSSRKMMFEDSSKGDENEK